VKILLHTILISAFLFGIQKPFSDFLPELPCDDRLSTKSLQTVGGMDSAGLVGKWSACSSEKEPLDTLSCGTYWFMQLFESGKFRENPEMWCNGSLERVGGEWTFEENLLHLRYQRPWSETYKHVYYKYSPTCNCLLSLEPGPQQDYRHLSPVPPVTPEE
jgi:hypothetical protein